MIEGGIADGAHQRRRRRLAGREGFRRQRGQAGPKRRAAHQVRARVHGVAEARRDGIQHVTGRRNDFRADAVTGDQGYRKTHVNCGLGIADCGLNCGLDCRIGRQLR
jgi:hypothetical protein